MVVCIKPGVRKDSCHTPEITRQSLFLSPHTSLSTSFSFSQGDGGPGRGHVHQVRLRLPGPAALRHVCGQAALESREAFGPRAGAEGASREPREARGQMKCVISSYGQE